MPSDLFPSSDGKKLDSALRGLHATPTAPLPFLSGVVVRSFILEREQGSVIIYNAPGITAARKEILALGPPDRLLLTHWHEAKHRIADPRILRLIRQWLEVGVLENGVYAETVEGTPQGAGISPLLANIFLHYALDLWVLQWMRRAATGPMRLVRYADDFLLTFERRADADRMATALAERLAKFGLRLHEDKTRLIEFGRFAAANRRRRSEGRPETFDFLGFTHYCGKTWDGRFMVHRKTQRGRLVRKLKELRQELKRRMHTPLREQHGWLARVLRGHYAYYGVTGNSYGLRRFLTQAVRAWHGAIWRRGQKRRMSWDRFNALLRANPLPPPRLVHVWRGRAA